MGTREPPCRHEEPEFVMYITARIQVSKSICKSPFSLQLVL